MLCVTASFVYHHIVCQIVIFLSCLTLFHFVCFISPNFSFPPFSALLSKLCQSHVGYGSHLSLSYCLTLPLSLLPPLFGCYHLSFSSTPCCSSSTFFSLAILLESVPPFLYPCPVSSDLYKSLQSGSQVALPPHLQLAFSGKI